MKRAEIVYREILYRVIENKETTFTQSEISKKFNLSLSIVNHAVKKLESLGAVKIMLRGFRVIDAKKILVFWASIRDLEKEIVLKTRMELPVREIEKLMPDITFTSYTAYKLRFNDVPSDYSEVYAYADEKELNEVKKRISKIKTSEKTPNLFILKKDHFMLNYNSLPIAQLYVDLWNLKEWYSKEFLNALEKRMGI